MIMQTSIHSLSFCGLNTTIIDRKPKFQFSCRKASFVAVPPTYSVKQTFHRSTTKKQFFALCAAPSDVESSPKDVESSLKDVESSPKDELVQITTVGTANSSEVKVHVEISGEKTETEFNLVFDKMLAAAQPIPGFRRVKGGKTPDIPRDILLEILGYSKVYRQVIKKLINSAIAEYVKKEDLKVGKDLKVEQSYEDLEETFEPGESFSFDATIQLQEVN